MASGDVIHAPAIAPENLPYAAALTASGRISRAIPPGVAYTFDENPPFAERDLIALDDALSEATRATKVRFNTYIGDATDPAAATDAVFPQTPEAARSVRAGRATRRSPRDSRSARPSSTCASSGQVRRAS